MNICLVRNYGSGRKHSLSFPELDFPNTECPALPSPLYTEFISRALEIRPLFPTRLGWNSPGYLCGQTLKLRRPGHFQTRLLIGKTSLNAGSGTPSHDATTNCTSPVPQLSAVTLVLASTVNLTQSRMAWEGTLTEVLSRPGRPVVLSVGIIVIDNRCGRTCP